MAKATVKKKSVTRGSVSAPNTAASRRLARWKGRITASNKAHDRWEKRFKCKILEKYYIGEQWSQMESEALEKYVINLVFPSIQIAQPSLLFYKPQFKIQPKQTRVDDMVSNVDMRAKLRQDTLNTFVSDRANGFDSATRLGILESFFRFAVVEVGYTADFIDNPNAGKPMLTDDQQPMRDSDDSEIREPEKTLTREGVYFKRIPARQFRVGVNGKNVLSHNDWCGYYEWHYLEDIRKNPRYKHTAGLKSAGKISSDYSEPDADREEETERRSGMVKLWKIWDHREKKKLVLLENSEEGFLLEEDIPTDTDGQPLIPFAVMKPHEILDEFYPLPPVFNWLHPQNELNETREMQRVHRKRFYRRYTYVDGSITDDEIQKLEDGGDGVYAKATRENPLQPVPDAPLDPAIVRNIPQTKEDFQQISGVTGEQRGVADSDTATQANIIDVRSRIRESYGRVQVAEWLSEIGTIALKIIEKNMALPFWISVSVDPLGPNAAEEALRVAGTWVEITTEQLGELSYDVTVDVESLSPVSEEQQRLAWNQVLGILTNPSLLMALMASETLLRKTLSFYGIRSEKEIREIQRTGQVVLMMLQAQAQSAQAAKGGGSGQPPAPGPTPSNSEIAMQIQEQIPVS